MDSFLGLNIKDPATSQNKEKPAPVPEQANVPTPEQANVPTPEQANVPTPEQADAPHNDTRTEGTPISDIPEPQTGGTTPADDIPQSIPSAVNRNPDAKKKKEKAKPDDAEIAKHKIPNSYDKRHENQAARGTEVDERYRERHQTDEFRNAERALIAHERSTFLIRNEGDTVTPYVQERIQNPENFRRKGTGPNALTIVHLDRILKGELSRFNRIIGAMFKKTNNISNQAELAVLAAQRKVISDYTIQVILDAQQWLQENVSKIYTRDGKLDGTMKPWVKDRLLHVDLDHQSKDSIEDERRGILMEYFREYLADTFNLVRTDNEPYTSKNLGALFAPITRARPANLFEGKKDDGSYQSASVYLSAITRKLPLQYQIIEETRGILTRGNPSQALLEKDILTRVYSILGQRGRAVSNMMASLPAPSFLEDFFHISKVPPCEFPVYSDRFIDRVARQVSRGEWNNNSLAVNLEGWIGQLLFNGETLPDASLIIVDDYNMLHTRPVIEGWALRATDTLIFHADRVSVWTTDRVSDLALYQSGMRVVNQDTKNRYWKNWYCRLGGNNVLLKYLGGAQSFILADEDTYFPERMPQSYFDFIKMTQRLSTDALYLFDPNVTSLSTQSHLFMTALPRHPNDMRPPSSPLDPYSYIAMRRNKWPVLRHRTGELLEERLTPPEAIFLRGNLFYMGLTISEDKRARFPWWRGDSQKMSANSNVKVELKTGNTFFADTIELDAVVQSSIDNRDARLRRIPEWLLLVFKSIYAYVVDYENEHAEFDKKPFPCRPLMLFRLNKLRVAGDTSEALVVYYLRKYLGFAVACSEHAEQASRRSVTTANFEKDIEITDMKVMMTSVEVGQIPAKYFRSLNVTYSQEDVWMMRPLPTFPELWAHLQETATPFLEATFHTVLQESARYVTSMANWKNEASSSLWQCKYNPKDGEGGGEPRKGVKTKKGKLLVDEAKILALQLQKEPLMFHIPVLELLPKDAAEALIACDGVPPILRDTELDVNWVDLDSLSSATPYRPDHNAPQSERPQDPETVTKNIIKIIAEALPGKDAELLALLNDVTPSYEVITMPMTVYRNLNAHWPKVMNLIISYATRSETRKVSDFLVKEFIKTGPAAGEERDMAIT